MLTLDGEILGLRQVQHEVDGPHVGWAQQRPDDWWTETCQAIRDVLSGANVAPESIAAVGACGQMHGPVGLDESGDVTTDWVQLWCEAVRRSRGESAPARWSAWIRDVSPRLASRAR